ncbi:GNAT family N-acetyltransferase [Paenibacillus sp. 19GGS1-52]|uniref:GNAT family N-acetyltransferase n=1 Tax=Paenibacillus sp. 19GGS1-52 TaxID=2758563 RepID=UPI001EFA93E1|nr:GNAT family N-acetyltransferase [Paenibacillus sp. 19GGS1-52]ULO09242.1 GNAT family N-acetyltransferase [Paenibacillus sp. 19GGS1-52]
MFERFNADDRVLSGKAFAQDELQHNLIHFISGIVDATKLKSSDGNLIFTQSAGHNPWLWVSNELEPEQREKLVQELVEYVKDDGYRGISAEPDTAKLFARAFCEVKGALFHTSMMLEAYHCPEVIKPLNVRGHLQQAAMEHTATIAGFMAGFSEDAFGMQAAKLEILLSMAEEAAGSGQMFLWMVDGTPVSMAKIAHRSTKLARINDVYTLPFHRKQGYASALVAELCAQLLQEKLTPMLYADAKNPDSNKVYQSIGFVEAGRIADIKFD